MGFVSRGGGEVVRWGPGRDQEQPPPPPPPPQEQQCEQAVEIGEEEKEGKGGRWKGGLAAGEEVLNHYCDVDLDVLARREWAVGALGGWCLCERCVWEEQEMGRQGTGGE